jgi:hypothetical protein
MNRRFTFWRQWLNDAPSHCKVILPSLHSWVEEADAEGGEQVGSFVQIAEGASIGEIFLARRPSMLLSNDVIYVVTELCFWAKAILAPVSHALSYRRPECRGNLHA